MNRIKRSATLVLVVTAAVLAASCGGGGRISLWKVAYGQQSVSGPCGSSPGTGTTTSTALSVGDWELWQEADGQLVLSGGPSTGGTSQGAACTLQGSAFKCESTMTSVNANGYGGTVTQSSAWTLDGTLTGDLLTGTSTSTISVTCDGGSCGYYTAQPACTWTAPFTAVRQQVDFVHAI